MVHHHRGHPLYLTVDGFVNQVVEEAVARIEKTHNNGKSYKRESK